MKREEIVAFGWFYFDMKVDHMSPGLRSVSMAPFGIVRINKY